jgi:hypothetical protein
MSSLDNVIAAYPSWERPWEFYTYVTHADGLQGQELGVFERAWAEVNDAKHWRSGDLRSCAELAAAAIQSAFPEVSASAAKAMANTAAYSWR